MDADDTKDHQASLWWRPSTNSGNISGLFLYSPAGQVMLYWLHGEWIIIGSFAFVVFPRLWSVCFSLGWLQSTSFMFNKLETCLQQHSVSSTESFQRTIEIESELGYLKTDSLHPGAFPNIFYYKIHIAIQYKQNNLFKFSNG